MALDTVSSGISPRILMACRNRRKGEPPVADIYQLDILTEKVTLMPREGNPAGLVYTPHGIGLVKNSNGDVLLYCINHGEAQKHHSIIVYRVLLNRLVFKEMLESPLMTAPNDVTAGEDGSVFFTNDSRKYDSFFETVFRMKTSNVLYTDGKDYKIILSGLQYGNGIALKGNRLVVVTTRGKKVFSLLMKKTESGQNYPIIADEKIIPGPDGFDNVNFGGPDWVLIPAHLNGPAYMAHERYPSKKSPTVVYRVDVINGKTDVVYSNNGGEISAGSSAIYYRGKLYISQVFQPYILRCEASDLK